MTELAKSNNPRTAKTERTLMDALAKLLQRRSFNRLTVNDICASAWLSRTAFYSHFQDKYDLLKFYLDFIAEEIADKKDFEGVKSFVNSYVVDNNRLIVNVLDEANAETLALVKNFLATAINLPASDEGDKQKVLSSFCVGGVLNCLTWQIENDFPELELINPHLTEIFSALKDI